MPLLDQARYFGRTGKDHAADAGIAGQGRADIACAEYELQCRSRNTGLMHQGNGVGSNQAGLFGRFGNNGVTGCQCRNHFAGKDGQWEVPWTDGNGAPTALASLGRVFSSFVGIVAASQRLRVLRQRRCSGFYRLRGRPASSMQARVVPTNRQNGAGSWRVLKQVWRSPLRQGGNGCTNSFLSHCRIGKADSADNIVVVCRVADGFTLRPPLRASPLTIDAAWKSSEEAV